MQTKNVIEELNKEELGRAFAEWRRFGLADYCWVINTAGITNCLVASLKVEWLMYTLPLFVVAFTITSIANSFNKKLLRLFREKHPEWVHIPDFEFLNIYYMDGRPVHMKGGKGEDTN